MIPSEYMDLTIVYTPSEKTQSGDRSSREMEYIVLFYNRPYADLTDRTLGRISGPRDALIRRALWGEIDGIEGIPKIHDSYLKTEKDQFLDVNGNILPAGHDKRDRVPGARLYLDTIRVERQNDRYDVRDFLGIIGDPRYNAANYPELDAADFPHKLFGQRIPAAPPEIWRATASYVTGSGSLREEETFTRRFSTQTKNVRIYEDLNYRSNWPPGFSPANPSSTTPRNIYVPSYATAAEESYIKVMVDDGLLNVDMKNNPDGADVFVPDLSFSYVWDNAWFSKSYQREISKYIAKVNETAFEGWEPGEVLFVGCTGDMRLTDSSNRQEYEGSLTMEFSVKRNRDNFSIGHIENIQSEGWQYVHSRYAPSPRGAWIIAVIVSDVYEKADLNDLGKGADVIFPIGSSAQPRVVTKAGAALPGIPAAQYVEVGQNE